MQQTPLSSEHHKPAGCSFSSWFASTTPALKSTFITAVNGTVKQDNRLTGLVTDSIHAVYIGLSLT